MAAYLGWERPQREIATSIDQAAEDAAFAAALSGFAGAERQSFNITDLTGH